MNGDVPKEQPRQRRPHSRHRTGCASCRKRHIRCDESRPICMKCLVRGNECKYPDLEIWRSDGNSSHPRPGFVGRQRWVAVWQLHRNTGDSHDPFDSLPTAMPLMSHELFKYLTHVHESECHLPLSKARLGKLLQDPSSTRNILLLAGLHYSWNIGGFQQYEATFLTHKIESIRIINTFISNPHADPDIIGGHVQSIATLCIMETTAGNIKAAEAHLDGLVALMESTALSSSNNNPENEYLRKKEAGMERYVLFCIQDVMRTKLRSLVLQESQQQQPSPQSVYQMRQYPRTGGILRTVKELGDRLITLWMIAYFVSARGQMLCHGINAPSFIYYLRTLTDVHVGCSPCHSIDPIYASADDELYKELDDSTAFYLWGLSENGIMIKRSQIPNEAYTCSWTGLSVAAGFYIYGVLTGGLALEAVQGRPALWIIRLLKEDIQGTEAAMISGSHSRDLWFWRVFLGAVGTAHAFATARKGRSAYVAEYQGSMRWFEKRVRLWSDTTGIKQWEEAKKALSVCVWPSKTPLEDLVVEIWHRATKTY